MPPKGKKGRRKKETGPKRRKLKRPKFSRFHLGLLYSGGKTQTCPQTYIEQAQQAYLVLFFSFVRAYVIACLYGCF